MSIYICIHMYMYLYIYIYIDICVYCGMPAVSFTPKPAFCVTDAVSCHCISFLVIAF